VAIEPLAAAASDLRGALLVTAAGWFAATRLLQSFAAGGIARGST
jgi:hypothetical protein